MKPLALALLCCALTRALAQEPCRLAGSTTVAGALLPVLDRLERAIGRKVEISANSSLHGLAAIRAGTADLAMISGTTEEVVKVLNARTPGAARADEFRSIAIGDVRLLCIVNPRNSVRQLTHEQLVGVFTGKLANWKEVGGPDAAIVVVSLANSTAVVQDKLLDGKPVTAQARLVPTAAQIPAVIAAERNAIGIISSAHPRGQTSLVGIDPAVSIPLFLVARGEPTAEQKQVIAAARQLLAN